MKRVLLGVAVAVVFLGAHVYVTFDQTGVECEVCIRYKGREACETVSAPDRPTAEMQARSSACTRLAGGVTETMACTRLRPTRMTCGD
jgi:hypothetical protein